MEDRKIDTITSTTQVTVDVKTSLPNVHLGAISNNYDTFQIFLGILFGLIAGMIWKLDRYRSKAEFKPRKENGEIDKRAFYTELILEGIIASMFTVFLLVIMKFTVELFFSDYIHHSNYGFVIIAVILTNIATPIWRASGKWVFDWVEGIVESNRKGR